MSPTVVTGPQWALGTKQIAHGVYWDRQGATLNIDSELICNDRKRERTPDNLKLLEEAVETWARRRGIKPRLTMVW